MKYRLLIPSLIFMMSSSIIFAGAWAQKAGSGFYKFDYRLLSAKKVFGPDGNKFEIPKLSDQTFSLYAEYGIIDRLTIGAYFPFLKLVKSEDTAALTETEKSGIGDLSMGFKYQFSSSANTVISGILGFGFPTGKGSLNGELATGYGHYSQTIGAEVGHSFYPLDLYVNGHLSFTNRNEGYSDEWLTAVEGGYGITDFLMIIGKIKLLRSLKNGDANVIGGYGGLYSNNQEYLAYGLDIVYKINSWFGLSATFESGTAARNIQSAPVLAFSLFLNK